MQETWTEWAGRKSADGFVNGIFFVILFKIAQWMGVVVTINCGRL